MFYPQYYCLTENANNGFSSYGFCYSTPIEKYKNMMLQYRHFYTSEKDGTKYLVFETSDGSGYAGYNITDYINHPNLYYFNCETLPGGGRVVKPIQTVYFGKSSVTNIRPGYTISNEFAQFFYSYIAIKIDEEPYSGVRNLSFKTDGKLYIYIYGENTPRVVENISSKNLSFTSIPKDYYTKMFYDFIENNIGDRKYKNLIHKNKNVKFVNEKPIREIILNDIAYIKKGDMPKLAKPTNITVNGTDISWDPVENANLYLIRIDDIDFGTISENSVNLIRNSIWLNIAEGEHTFCVKAYANGYNDSDESTAQVTKIPNDTILGTWVFKDWASTPIPVNIFVKDADTAPVTVDFNSNGSIYHSFVFANKGTRIYYSGNSFDSAYSWNGTSGVWANEALKTVTFTKYTPSQAMLGFLDFLLKAAVKQ